MAGKIALITGITGQDGSYLTEFLLSKGYTVSYLSRFDAFVRDRLVESSSNNRWWNGGIKLCLYTSEIMNFGRELRG